ncbi:hypothetical protein KUTeg_012271 [Tegillarca granosa]|uniref:Uncharacterized protein n=1 Tax=Tegillarca granosa TaxID=220873 RepID=A0ABQ9F2H9_TEGGR|nr:hypothetical protein KUTeg_012271 [Tegillarca granosa]
MRKVLKITNLGPRGILEAIKNIHEVTTASEITEMLKGFHDVSVLYFIRGSSYVIGYFKGSDVQINNNKDRVIETRNKLQEIIQFLEIKYNDDFEIRSVDLSTKCLGYTCVTKTV